MIPICNKSAIFSQHNLTFFQHFHFQEGCPPLTLPAGGGAHDFIANIVLSVPVKRENWSRYLMYLTEL